MIVKIKPINPDIQVFQVSFTMQLKELKELKEQLASNWPSWEVGGLIGKCIDQAERNFIEETK